MEKGGLMSTKIEVHRWIYCIDNNVLSSDSKFGFN